MKGKRHQLILPNTLGISPFPIPWEAKIDSGEYQSRQCAVNMLLTRILGSFSNHTAENTPQMTLAFQLIS
ncbi:hypothetical protein [Thaumasiovibrio subtropicus]|uniref:hypothetical protein n=1 Tax=Thaumasiovibrio subtropicus TaxID=1891207 RepID=UPI000B35F67B|nr:hypothetical protein [Thaumasiovibrio subtropicus]